MTAPSGSGSTPERRSSRTAPPRAAARAASAATLPAASKYPQGVAIDAQGRILVGDDNYRVDRFSVAGDGTVSFDRSFGIDVDPSDGDTGDFENCTTASGCRFGSSPSDGAGGIVDPAELAVDAQGRILVADADRGRIARFAVAGDGTVGFDRAFGVDVDPSDGDTGDFENCTTASGCQAGTQSDAAGGIASPSGVAVDGQGRILVADPGNRRVDRFSPGPTVTVTNVLAPATDPGTFDLRVDAVVVRAAAANGESGALQVADGVDVTISEQAADGQLSDYDTTIDCGGGPRSGTSLTVADVRADVDCTITNTRKAPAPPPGPGTGRRAGNRHDRAVALFRVADQHDVRRPSSRRRRGPCGRPREAGHRLPLHAVRARAGCFHDQASHDRPQVRRQLPQADEREPEPSPLHPLRPCRPLREAVGDRREPAPFLRQDRA